MSSVEHASFWAQDGDAGCWFVESTPTELALSLVLRRPFDRSRPGPPPAPPLLQRRRSPRAPSSPADG